MISDLKDDLRAFLQDIRYFRIFPKRYKGALGVVPDDKQERLDYWSRQGKGYYNFVKRVRDSSFRWYVITYKDGHKELAYFRVWYLTMPRTGRLCRGIIFPRLWHIFDYERTESIRIAF